VCRDRLVEICSAVALSFVLMTASDAQPSAVMCDHYAHNLAQQRSAQGQMLGGAATGSLVGLGIGALFAASGVGAAVGATAGLIGGGAARQKRAQQIYAAAYQDCMAGRVR
jgi:hypothetical protein